MRIMTFVSIGWIVLNSGKITGVQKRLIQSISQNLFIHTDTCNVYVLRSGHRAVLIDFGDGSILEELPQIGVTEVTDVLLTHHHRDQVQGLRRLAGTKTRIHAPETERHLIDQVDRHWQARLIYDSYQNATDRFSLLEPVMVDETLRDYAILELNDLRIEIVPTPGHTLGSVSFLVEVDGGRVLFCGDLLYEGGRLWSLAATQWGYNDAPGVVATLYSLRDIRHHQPDVLLPSHGGSIADPSKCMDDLEARLWKLLEVRNQAEGVRRALNEPLHEITPHLLWFWPSQSHNYFLLSESGKALMIDCGYQGLPQALGYERHCRRGLDYGSRPLREKYGITKVDVIVPTHYHDDHIAGIPAYQQRHGSRVWAAENFYHLLQQPDYYDVPCLWFEPIRLDRVLHLETPVKWEEYTLRLLPLPGHTLYAAMIFFEVDGKRVLATGDQHGNTPEINNYVYKNRFRHYDYVECVRRYRELAPDLIISGHWEPHFIEPDYFDQMAELGERLESLHESILPLKEINLGAEGTAVFIRPYQSWVAPGECAILDVEVWNPLPEAAKMRLELITPEGWQAEPRMHEELCPAGERLLVRFKVTPTNTPVRRARVGVDVTAGERRLGQMAEALISVGVAPGPL